MIYKPISSRDLNTGSVSRGSIFVLHPSVDKLGTDIQAAHGIPDQVGGRIDAVVIGAARLERSVRDLHETKRADTPPVMEPALAPKPAPDPPPIASAGTGASRSLTCCALTIRALHLARRGHQGIRLTINHDVRDIKCQLAACPSASRLCGKQTSKNCCAF